MRIDNPSLEFNYNNTHMRYSFKKFRAPSLLECIYGKDPKEVHVVYPFAGIEVFTSYVYPLTEDNLKIIPEDCQYGTYRIGYFMSDKFFVRYIGRSIDHEGGLRERLREHIGEFEGNPHFMFFPAHTPEEAYNDECLDFHAFYEGEDGFLTNKDHPNRQGVNATLHCPLPMCDK